MNGSTVERMAETPARRRASARRVLARTQVGLDRVASWGSALLLFLFFVSGFGMTKPDLVSSMTGGLVSWRVAYDMHNALHVPLLVAFTFHTFTGLQRALVRTTRRRRLAALLAGGIGLVVAGYLLTLILHESGL